VTVEPQGNFNSDHDSKKRTQTHVHEYLGSTKIDASVVPHNHRFAGVTGEAIPEGNSHVHQLFGNTDFFVGHLHELGAKTGPAIPVGKGRHIHFAYGKTTKDAGHIHEFIFATLIEDPSGKD